MSYSMTFDALLERVLDLPESKHRAFLESNADPATAREILRLLEHEEQIGDLFSSPALEIVPDGLPTLDGGGAGPGTSDGPDLPESIGGYKILRVLGEGGMGIVYLARQRDPVERLVALKVVRPGMHSPNNALRLAAERQALARFSHPNIAQMFEAGTTATGSPFFAMEYIDGIPVTEYCEQHKLSIDQRLRLFVEICRGVQHAHQRGIIHRDLKPTNILIAEDQGPVVPKIIDFGIAKALDQPLTAGTLETALFVGTPGYISPEATLMVDQPSDPDTRTDVYALGVLLYELLLGVRPFDFQGMSLSQVVRRLQEDDPPSLTRRLGSLDSEEAADLAAKRGLSPEELRVRLQGELSWIVAKAVERKREERYSSVVEPALDVERHLGHEPLSVAPPSVLYRVRKLARRHRMAVVAAGIAVAALAIGVLGLAVGLVEARREKHRAEVAEAQARYEASSAHEVVDFLVRLFEISDPEISRGEDVTARELLGAGAVRIRHELGGQPEIQARLMRTLGEVHLKLGMFEAAESLVQEAIAIRQEAGLPAGRDGWVEGKLLGRIYHNLGRLDEAVDLLESTLDRQEEGLPPEDAVLLETLHHLGQAQRARGHHDEAERVLRRALDIAESSFGPRSKEVSLTLSSLAAVHGSQGQFDTARGLLERSLRIQRQTLGADHPSALSTMTSLGVVLSYLQAFEQADQVQDEALGLSRRVFDPTHPRIRTLLGNIGYFRYRRGLYEEALGPLKEAVSLDEQAGEVEDHALASRLTNLGLTYWKLGQAGKAEPLLKRAMSIRDRILPPDHPHHATSMWGLANIYRDEGRYEEAEALYGRALEIRRKKYPLDHPELVDAVREYAVLLRLTGRGAEASRLEADHGHDKLSPNPTP